ncbi:hypothetical protein GCM10009716_41500 [Streptomyces sodiiphilus]|uniref:Uncharacterized protein n=1 Tax=Streptomyces sodiiphilus TaxID=226217 RepID=A0ABN2PU68_9ACTN
MLGGGAVLGCTLSCACPGLLLFRVRLNRRVAGGRLGAGGVGEGAEYHRFERAAVVQAESELIAAVDCRALERLAVGRFQRQVVGVGGAGLVDGVAAGDPVPASQVHAADLDGEPDGAAVYDGPAGAVAGSGSLSFVYELDG